MWEPCRAHATGLPAIISPAACSAWPACWDCAASLKLIARTTPAKRAPLRLPQAHGPAIDVFSGNRSLRRGLLDTPLIRAQRSRSGSIKQLAVRIDLNQFAGVEHGLRNGDREIDQAGAGQYADALELGAGGDKDRVHLRLASGDTAAPVRRR
jgi:hypothetical protein